MKTETVITCALLALVIVIGTVVFLTPMHNGSWLYGFGPYQPRPALLMFFPRSNKPKISPKIIPPDDETFPELEVETFTDFPKTTTAAITHDASDEVHIDQDNFAEYSETIERLVKGVMNYDDDNDEILTDIEYSSEEYDDSDESGSKEKLSNPMSTEEDVRDLFWQHVLQDEAKIIKALSNNKFNGNFDKFAKSTFDNWKMQNELDKEMRDYLK